MALLEQDWLPKARGLAIGQRQRFVHAHEGRANMIVSNERDRWQAYCQRCKQGGVLMKEHVLLTAAKGAESTQVLTWPDDARVVAGSEYEPAIGRFLASKGMMFPYLPDLSYSLKAQRLLFCGGVGLHGRDLTGRSPRKWLNYSGSTMDGDVMCRPSTVLVEDLFSMYKLKYALRWAKLDEFGVVCTLGAGVHERSVLALKNCTRLVWAYDADKAGDDGYKLGRKRMQVFVPTQVRARPPEGLDPKDMHCEDLVRMIERATA